MAGRSDILDRVAVRRRAALQLAEHGDAEMREIASTMDGYLSPLPGEATGGCALGLREEPAPKAL
jgi:hypothetical protein